MEENRIKSSNSQCPNCGSALFYDPKSQELICKACDSITKFNKSKDNQKADYVEGSSVNNNEWSKESRVFQCKTCGAQVVVTGFDVTASCPYCASVYVSETKELPGIKPNRVIPFAYNEADASLIFAKNVKRKFFVPSALKKQLPENKIRGIYLPTFTFDSNTKSSYKGVLEKRETRTVNGKTRTYVKRFNISGDENVNFVDLVVESSSKIDSKQMKCLLPYNMQAGYHFDSNFLRGYQVEHYQDSLDSCYYQAKLLMDNTIRNRILDKYTYSSVVSLNVYTNYLNRKYAYSLLPVYSFEFVYRNKTYIPYMNGQTGKIGKGLPISPLKVTFVSIFGGLMVIAVLIIIIIYLKNK